MSPCRGLGFEQVKPNDMNTNESNFGLVDYMGAL